MHIEYVRANRFVELVERAGVQAIDFLSCNQMKHVYREMDKEKMCVVLQTLLAVQLTLLSVMSGPLKKVGSKCSDDLDMCQIEYGCDNHYK